MAKNVIESHKKEFDPTTGKNKWTIKYVDGPREHKELATFIDLCDACAQNWVDTRKNHGCWLKKTSCCEECAKKCSSGFCQLKYFSK